MTKVIKLDNYKRDRDAMANRTKMLRIQGGYRWADLALQIMCEEMAKRDDIDTAAVWYSFMRFCIKALRGKGWSDRDMQRIFRDVFKEK